MSFVPQQRQPGGKPPAVYRILYWALMIVVAVGLWELDSKRGMSGSSRWMALLVAAVTVLLILGVAYIVRKKIGPQRPKGNGPPNRPLG
jgi:hypothetical protein